MESGPQAVCPECGASVEFASASCPRCGQELSWPGQEREQPSFARPLQEALGCFLVPLTSVVFAALLAVILAAAFAFIEGRYGVLAFGLAAILLIASRIKRIREEQETPQTEDPEGGSHAKAQSRKGQKKKGL